MLVASTPADFASALTLLSTDAKAWNRVSKGGLALATAQSKSERFASDVRSLVSNLALKPKAKATPTPTSTRFLSVSALRSQELAMKSRVSHFDMMSGSGGTGSQGGCPTLASAYQVLVSIGRVATYGGCACGSDKTQNSDLLELAACAIPPLAPALCGALALASGTLSQADASEGDLVCAEALTSVEGWLAYNCTGTREWAAAIANNTKLNAAGSDTAGLFLTILSSLAGDLADPQTLSSTCSTGSSTGASSSSTAYFFPGAAPTVSYSAVSMVAAFAAVFALLRLQ